MRAYYESLIEAWSAPQYVLDKRFVQLALLLDQGVDRQARVDALRPVFNQPTEQVMEESGKRSKASKGSNSAQIPPFYSLEDKRFKSLVRRLIESDEATENCEAVSFQHDLHYGIDLVVNRSDGSVHVVRCICEEDVNPLALRAVGDAFLGYWDSYWVHRNVRTFILVLACQLAHPGRLKEIERQRKRFQGIEVKLELLDARQLAARLAPYPAMAGQLFPDHPEWVSLICGRMPQPIASTLSSPADSVSTSSAESEILALLPLLESNVEETLNCVRDMDRRGATAKAIEELYRLREEAVLWKTLSPVLKARVLRLEAAFRLRRSGEQATVECLVKEARTLDDGAGARSLDALVRLERGGPESALEFIGDDTNSKLVPVKAVSLLRLGKAQAARDLLIQTEPKRDLLIQTEPKDEADAAEYARLLALARFYCGELGAGLDDAREACRLAPEFRLAREALAILLYYRALSPATRPPQANPDCLPVDWTLVCRDGDSVSCLREAEKIFAKLLEPRPRDLVEWRRLTTCRLACLANDSGRREEAAQYANELLARDPCHATAVAWALARGFEFDWRKCKRKLIGEANRGTASSIQVVALVALICRYSANATDLGKARKLLDSYRVQIEADGADELWLFWSAQIATASGDVATTIKIVEPQKNRLGIRGKLLALNSQANDGQLRKELSMLGQQALEANDNLLLIEICETLARRGALAAVEPFAAEIVDRVGTADAVWLGALATHAACRYKDSLRLLEDNADLFPGGQLSHEMRRLRADCLEKLGRPEEALDERNNVYQATGELHDLMATIDRAGRWGDRPRLLLAARSARKHSDLALNDAIYVAQLIAHDDKDLAIDLLRRVDQTGLPDQLVPHAYTLGLQLGIEREFETLAVRFGELAREGRAGVQALKLEQFVELMGKGREQLDHLNMLYKRGDVPIHLIVSDANVNLADLYHRDLLMHERDSSTRGVLLARYGGRPLPKDFPSRPEELRLNLDVTAFLMAAHLELLDLVGDHF